MDEGPGEGGTDDPTTPEVFTLSVDGAEFDERLVDLIHIIERARRNYTKEELAEQLIELAHQIGRSPSTVDVLSTSGMASPGTYGFVFGKSWSDILRELGLNPINNFTKDELAELLVGFANELGRTPSVAEVARNEKIPDRKTFECVFALQWKEVLQTIGLPPNEQHTYTKEELSQQIRDFANQLGRSPTREEVRKNPSMANPKAFLRVFNGSWTGMLQELGLSTSVRNIPYTREELGEQFTALANKLGDVPSATDVAKDPDTASPTAFVRAFGKPWKDVRQELGSAITSRK